MKNSNTQTAEQPALFTPPQVETEPKTPGAKVRKNAVTVKEPAQLATPVSEVEQMIAMFERCIRDPAVDVAKAREIMAMRKELAAERAEQVFNDAMAAAQAEIGMVGVDKSNPQTKSRYASYPALDRAIRPIYSKHNFALSFDTEEGAPSDCIRVVCFVSCAGHTRKYRLDMPADGKGAKGGDVMTKTHATGSGVSYGMRYLLKMIFNVPTGEDDDGNKAGRHGKTTRSEIEVDVINNGPAKITLAQHDKLVEALEDAGVPRAKFCEVYKIAKVAELDADMYDVALRSCVDYKARKAAEKAGSARG